MTKDRRKQQREERLGMSISTAEKKLRKSIIFELAQQLGKNVCLHCGLRIDEPDDLAIKHVEDWEGDPARFFDLSNIAFGHVACGADDHGRRQEEEQMRRVEVIIEDQHGTRLRGCTHHGQTYVAGAKDQRYQIRVRNTTNRRLLVVVSVDGRNVNTGQKGDWNDSGHVLEPYAQWVFTGWRQSDDQVAAFRLGTKDDSYSAQMGSPENVGVIGVAVFEERQPEKKVITIKEREYIPVPYPVPAPYPFTPPWDPFRPRPIWIGPILHGGTTTTETVRTMGMVRSVGSTGDSWAASASNLSFSCAVDQSPGAAQTDTYVAAALGHQQELGTEYGESLSSHVVKSTFAREGSPQEVITIRYDSLERLVAAGIMGQKPSEHRNQAPRAFPQSPDVGPGYCAPPPRVREYKG